MTTTKSCLYGILVLFFIHLPDSFAQAPADTILANQYYAKGKSFNTLSKYDSAIRYFQKAAAIYEKAEYWQGYVGCLNKMSRSYCNSAKYKKAMTLGDQALEISLEKLGKETPEEADAYQSIGYVYDMKGSMDKALEYYQESLRLRKKIYGTSHPKTAISYNIIGSELWRMGKYKEAMITLHEDFFKVSNRRI